MNLGQFLGGALVGTSIIRELVPALEGYGDPAFLIIAGLGLYYIARISENLEKNHPGENR